MLGYSCYLTIILTSVVCLKVCRARRGWRTNGRSLEWEVWQSDLLPCVCQRTKVWSQKKKKEKEKKVYSSHIYLLYWRLQSPCRVRLQRRKEKKKKQQRNEHDDLRKIMRNIGNWSYHVVCAYIWCLCKQPENRLIRELEEKNHIFCLLLWRSFHRNLYWTGFSGPFLGTREGCNG